MMGAKTLEAQIADGTAKIEGNASILKQLAAVVFRKAAHRILLSVSRLT